jgi:cell division protein FtsQ
MKHTLDIVFWIGLTAYIFAAMSFVSLRKGEMICTSVEVCILDSMRRHFVTVQDILQVVDHPSQKLRGKLLDSINSMRLEERLAQLAPVRRAEVYKTGNGTVHVDILQRSPVLRIINRYGESYYLDETGQTLKHTSRYSVHVLVANGYIDRRTPERNGLSQIETAQGKRNIVKELFDLAVWIGASKFWNAQIQQIYVREDGDFELIPRVGAHVILFGKCEKIDEKFSKLEALYRNGFNVTGWNKYDVINLKYDGQIVCTKR